MTVCTPSDCPAVTPEHMAEMHAKYLRERDRRVRKEANAQYIPASGKWADVYEVDPYTPVTPRDPVTGRPSHRRGRPEEGRGRSGPRLQ